LSTAAEYTFLPSYESKYSAVANESSEEISERSGFSIISVKRKMPKIASRKKIVRRVTRAEEVKEELENPDEEYLQE
jgi:hypothetical protein